ncbi:MAG TPA: glutathione S-transferase family protein, partial [Casimicrobiaceae bacterium]
MTDLELHFLPGTCARVALIALEQCGVPFTSRLLKPPVGEPPQPGHLAIDPQGEVPTLAVGGQPLTGNIAIVSFLARTCPDAGLLPFGHGELADAQTLSQFSWLAATVHPMVTRILMPQLFCDTAV